MHVSEQREQLLPLCLCQQKSQYWRNRDGVVSIRISEPVEFYLPEHSFGPGRLRKGDELWAEVTVPKKGPPRPIQLGVHHSDGSITPLAVH